MTFARRLLSGTVQLTFSNGLARICAVLALPVLTTLLTTQAYGVAALVTTILSLASVVALAGLDMSYARAYHSSTPPTGFEVEHYCWKLAITLGVCAGVVCSGVWWLIGRHSTDLQPDLGLFLLLGVPLVVAGTMAQTRARLTGRYRTMAAAAITVGLVVPLTSIAIASVWRQDAVALLLAAFFGYAISLLVLGIPSIVALSKRVAVSSANRRHLIGIGLPGVLTAPMYWMLSMSDRWFLQHYHGVEAVGVYVVGYGIGAIGLIFNSALMSVWLPEAAKEYEQSPQTAHLTLGGLMSRLIAALSLVWLIVASLGSDVLLLLTDAKFHAAAVYVPYIAGGVFFYGVFQLANTNLLLGKRLVWSAFWWVVGGVVCVVLNITLVPTLGALGAAVTQTISFAFISATVFTVAQRLWPVRIRGKRLALTLALVASGGFLMAVPWHQTPLVSLALKVPCTVAVASIIAWLMAPDWCGLCLRYISKRAVAS